MKEGSEEKIPPEVSYLRWSYMPLGRPVSQLCGALQGRSERFSDSVLAQPPEARPARTSTRRKAQRRWEIQSLTTRDGRG